MSKKSKKVPDSECVEYSTGFIGNLTTEQRDLLEKFESQCSPFLQKFPNFDVHYNQEEKELFSKIYCGKNVKEYHCFLLRFLRARRFNLDKAYVMLSEYMKWREYFKVDLICRSVQFPWILKLRFIYPHGYHGVDKLGRPIYIERLGKAHLSSVLKLIPSNFLLSYWVQQYEYFSQVILPACSIARGKRVEQGISIIDLTGFGLSHLSSGARDVIRKLAHLTQNYYPELLGKMIIVNVPGLFGPLWLFMKSLIDEGTIAKISLYTGGSAGWKKKLLELVDADQLPEFLGGSLRDEGWQLNETGPWKDTAVLAKLHQKRPDIPEELLYLDVSTGNMESLNLLEMEQSTMTV